MEEQVQGALVIRNGTQIKRTTDQDVFQATVRTLAKERKPTDELRVEYRTVPTPNGPASECVVALRPLLGMKDVVPK